MRLRRFFFLCVSCYCSGWVVSNECYRYIVCIGLSRWSICPGWTTDTNQICSYQTQWGSCRFLWPSALRLTHPTFSPPTSAHVPRAPCSSTVQSKPWHRRQPSTVWPHLLPATKLPCLQSIVLTEVLNFHQGGEDGGGEGCAGQMYLIVSSIPPPSATGWLFGNVCVCVCVCVFQQWCYESVIRVVTHLSNAPIPLGCHTL